MPYRGGTHPASKRDAIRKPTRSSPHLRRRMCMGSSMRSFMRARAEPRTSRGRCTMSRHPVGGRTLRVVRDVSAGGVISRVEDGRLEVVLVGRAQPERWSIPKGTPVSGESIEQTALREVREETGLIVKILEPLGEIKYSFSTRGIRHHKTVHFYLLEAIGGSTQEHDWENDFVAWLSDTEALGRMSFASEAAIVARAIKQTRARAEVGIAREHLAG
ncbi:MAG: NUDIX domain-containing protein [Chloroflexi bacterium]|nr:NUDIX domain-containing protein [Chloroflexota bacterium]